MVGLSSARRVGLGRSGVGEKEGAFGVAGRAAPRGRDPHPKARLPEQVREVVRLQHYSLCTERSYWDWIRHYVKFHHLRCREELMPGEAKGVGGDVRDAKVGWSSCCMAAGCG